jgi:hypothetical protein
MRNSIFEKLEMRRLLNGLPRMSIGDVSVDEGNSGNGFAAVVVNLSEPRPKQPVTVNYATQNGTATAGSDFTAASGKVTFAVGQMSKTILIPITGDRASESNEQFVINLNTAKQARIADGQAVITIVDDEPRISISGTSAAEGNSGNTPLVFTVSLAAAYDQMVTVNFATADYTAIAGTDYVAAAGTVTFIAGDTSETVTVQGIGNATPEPEKYFYVNLSGASANAVIASNYAYGSISDDDGYVDPGYYDYGWYGYYDYGYYYW